MTKQQQAELVRQCSFEPIYSGPQSARVWTAVNRGPETDVLYALGCVLQDIEERFLLQLNRAVQVQVADAVRKSAAIKKRRTVR